MSDETIKATFLVSPAAKYRLSSLKAKLRREGFVETESSLLERLLTPAYIQSLEDDVRRATGRKTGK